MKKSTTNLIIYLNLGSEMLYILNNRIKSLDNVDESKRNSIMVQIATNLYQNNEFDSMISESTSILSLEGFHNMFHKVCHKSVITLDPSSFSKMIEMVLMALKKDLLLMKNDYGIYSVTMNHFEGVEKIIKKKNVTENMKEVVSKKFSEMSPYEFTLTKRAILNLLVNKHSKISIYLKDDIQDNDGHFIIKPNKNCGFHVNKTGNIFKLDGTVEGAIAGIKPSSSYFRVCKSWRDEANDYLGCDLFENLKKGDLVIVDSKYLSNLNQDMTTKIIGTSKVSDRVETMNMDMDFEGAPEVKINQNGTPVTSEQYEIFQSSVGKKNKAAKLFEDEVDQGKEHGSKDEKRNETSSKSGAELLSMFDDL